MSHPETNEDTNDDLNMDAVRRILARRRTAAVEPHALILRVLARQEGNWRWLDRLDVGRPVLRPMLDDDLVRIEEIPQPDGSYRERLVMSDLGLIQHRQIQAEIERSPWVHTDAE